MLAPGVRLARYEIRSLLGAGGMGEVYLAWDGLLEREVALKTLPPELATDPLRRARLEREARSASALNHPNILTVYEIGEVDGILYLATELVVGQTLRQRLEAGRLPVGEALAVATQVAAAIGAAAGAGIVHRDLKPENVMLRPDGWVKVLDFGLARPAVHEENEAAAQLTRPHTLLGTLSYMSPEQVRELPLDSRSDLWSLGVLLYEMLTRCAPFGGFSTADILAAILGQEPAPLLAARSAMQAGAGLEPLPDGLQAIVDRLLARNREQRYPDATALLADLRRVQRRVDEVGGPADSFAPQPFAPAPEAGSQGVPALTRGSLLTQVPTALVESPLDVAPNNLPSELGAFIGRRDELRTVEELLAAGTTRLVTLTGPGGAGKTRLAIHAAADLLATFRDGAFFVALAGIRDPALVPSVVAAALGVKEAGGLELERSLVEALRGRHLLLVLDNLEQVLASGALIARLLAALPRLAVLATSRESLRLTGESEVPLPPLATPALDRPLPLAELAGCDAITLFAERARAARPDFRLTVENAPTVAAICARLDGLPLAIELAAARIRLLPPAALLARLGRRLELLTGGARDLPARQQTMRSALAWSYDLLDAREQRLLRTLAIFEGPFSLSAAQAVSAADTAGVTGIAEPLELLSSLVDKSLLRRHPERAPKHAPENCDAEPWFDMLGTLREFGREQLTANGELAAVAARHADWALAQAEALAPARQGGEGATAAALDELGRVHDDLRAAFDSALAGGNPDLALRLAAALWWFWYLHGHYSEGRRRLDAALQAVLAPGAPALTAAGRAARLQALVGAGTLAFLQCDYTRARALLDVVLAAAPELGDHRSLGQALQILGSAAREQGDYATARRRHGQSLEVWRSLGDERGAARSRNYLAFVAWLEGDAATAQALAGDTLATFRRLADPEGVAWSTLNHVGAALAVGDLAAAAEDAVACLTECRQAGFQEGIAWALNLHGEVARRQGDLASARRDLAEALAIHRSLGDRWRLASVLEALAATTLAAGAADAAQSPAPTPSGERGIPAAIAGRLLGAADALRATLGAPVPPIEQAAVAATRRQLVARWPPATFATLLAEGGRMPIEEAVALAVGDPAAVRRSSAVPARAQ
jgi:non-specific serine/threonine protein kinase